jgi:hypothetical protein
MRLLRFAIGWFTFVGVLRASIADAWISALLTTRFQSESGFFVEGATVETVFTATLAAVQTQHPSLPSLRISASPIDLLAVKKPRVTRSPKGEFVAAELLLSLAGADARVEITDEQLLIVAVAPRAESLRKGLQHWYSSFAMLEAMVAGKADGPMLSQACRILNRAGAVTRVASMDGALRASALAFFLVLQSSDAKQRFEIIERDATPAGKIYARAGLLHLGWAIEDVARLGPLTGQIWTVSGDIVEQIEAQAFFDRSVSNGRFMRDLGAFAPTAEALAAKRNRMEPDLKLWRSKISGPGPVGRVLADEADWISPAGWISPPK